MSGAEFLQGFSVPPPIYSELKKQNGEKIMMFLSWSEFAGSLLLLLISGRFASKKYYGCSIVSFGLFLMLLV